jgi:hypothetical protein
MPDSTGRLDENDVIDRVCTFLTARGFEITKRLRTTERGVDIVARFPQNGPELWVEAKGGTSADPRSPRYGLGFDSAQRKDHFSVAVYSALRHLSLSEGGPDRVGIALPDEHRSAVVQPVLPILQRLGILVFLVAADGSVEVLGDLAGSRLQPTEPAFRTG